MIKLDFFLFIIKGLKIKLFLCNIWLFTFKIKLNDAFSQNAFVWVILDLILLIFQELRTFQNWGCSFFLFFQKLCCVYLTYIGDIHFLCQIKLKLNFKVWFSNWIYMQRELSSISQFNIHSVEKQKLNLMRFFIDINTYLAEL